MFFPTVSFFPQQPLGLGFQSVPTGLAQKVCALKFPLPVARATVARATVARATVARAIVAIHLSHGEISPSVTWWDPTICHMAGSDHLSYGQI